MRAKGRRRWVPLFLLPALATAAVVAAQTVPSPKLPSRKTASFGEPIPFGAYANLNAGPGGADRIDLQASVGRTPIVLCYFSAGDPRSVAVLRDVQDLAVRLGTERIAVYGVTTLSGTMDVAKLRERVRELNLRVPVLYDDGPTISFQLMILRIPSISIFDKEGRLRLSNGGSLKQALEYKMDLADAIRRVAETGRLGTYGMLPNYYPAVEMVGERYRDFEAPMAGEKGTRTLSSLFRAGMVNVLIFWAQDCPHCRKSLPAIDAWFREHPDEVNIVTAAQVSGEAGRVRTEEYVQREKLTLPTFLDQDFKIGRQYLISSTPTVFIIRPDGVIDSVLLTSEADYGAVFEAKRKQILRI